MTRALPPPDSPHCRGPAPPCGAGNSHIGRFKLLLFKGIASDGASNAGRVKAQEKDFRVEQPCGFVEPLRSHWSCWVLWTASRPFDDVQRRNQATPSSADFHDLSPRGFHHHSPTPGFNFSIFYQFSSLVAILLGEISPHGGPVSPRSLKKIALGRPWLHFINVPHSSGRGFVAFSVLIRVPCVCGKT